MLTLLLGVAFVVAAWSTTTSVTPGAPANEVLLPLRVFPADGASEHAEPVTVYVSDPSGVDSLYIQGHALGYHKSDYADQVGYDKKASFRVNGGAWVPIDNDQASCKYPEKLYNCIGGPYHTLRLELPLAATGAVQAGENIVEFRFNGTDGTGNGYRILDLELRRGDDSDAIDGTTFREDNPDNWTAPAGADAQRGKQLWEARHALVDNPLKGDPIVAACADCHAPDGRDLKYFNYSNRAIEVRSRFHGLSQQDGEDIAAYIRNYDLETAYRSWPSELSLSDLGRPWNPPYQPGPGLTDKPVEQWAAGAGLEWVLDSEREQPGTQRDMLTHIFPNGVQGEAGFEAVKTGASMEFRNIPIAMQLPDWNNWLPDVHPLDSYGESMTLNTPFFQYFENDLIPCLEDAGCRNGEIAESADNAGNLYIKGIWDKLDEWNRQEGLHLVVEPKPEWQGDEQALDDLSVWQWRTVLMWFVHEKYSLNDLGEEIFANNPNGYEYGKDIGGYDYTWIGDHMVSYKAAPHMNDKEVYPGVSPYPTQDQNIFFSSAWYQLSLMLKPGSKKSRNGSPYDWNYHHPHIEDASERYRHNQALRFLTSQVIVQQQKDNYSGLLAEGVKVQPWHEMHTMQPMRIAWTTHRSQYMWDTMDPTVRRDFTEQILRAWLRNTLEYDTADWPRGEDWGGGDLLPASYTPTLGDGDVGHLDYNADYYYRMLHHLDNLGVSPTLIDSAASWGKEMWPNGDWSIYEHDGGTPPQVTLTAPAGGATYAEGDAVEMQADAQDDGSVQKVIFYSGSSKLGEATGSPYAFTWDAVPAGSYELSAEAVDNDGLRSRSNRITITVEAPSDGGDGGDGGDGDDGSGGGSGGGDSSADLPSGWSSSDVGGVSATGTATYESGTYTLEGSGSDIWGQQDEYHFAYADQSGDAALTARVTSVSATDAWTKAGVMMRAGLEAGAPNVALVVTPEGVVSFQYRSTTDGSTTTQELTGDAPIWLRLTRSGDRFVAETSADGASWTVVGEQSLSLTSELQAGLALSSHSDGTLATATFDQVQLGSSSGGGTTAPETEVEQVIELDKGWNMISRNVVLDDPTFSVAMAPVWDNVKMIKNEAGDVISPKHGIDEIGTWEATEAYMVFMKDAATLTLVGEPIDSAQMSVSLQEGWNFVPYLGQASRPIEEATAPIADDLVIVKNVYGEIYYPEYGVNSLVEMAPGSGYKVYVARGTNFSLGSGTSASVASGKTEEVSRPSFSAPGGSPESAVVIVRAEEIDDGTKLALRAGTEPVVEGIVADGQVAFVVHADDPETQSAEGLRTGQEMTIAHAGADAEGSLFVSSVQEVLTDRTAETLQFEPDAIFAVAVQDAPGAIQLHGNAPNPFRTTTTIRYELPEPAKVRIELFDAAGRRVRTIEDAQLEPGVHEATLSAEGLASGMYVYRLEAGSTVKTRQLVLVK